MANTWLFKTEPSAYSFSDLQKDVRTTWDGVKNPQALRNLGQVKPGDRVFVYHTADEKAVVGIARAIGKPYADPRKSDPKLLVIDLEAVKPLARPVTLAEMKVDNRFRGFDLLRLPRLSVMPVSTEYTMAIDELARKSG